MRTNTFRPNMAMPVTDYKYQYRHNNLNKGHGFMQHAKQISLADILTYIELNIDLIVKSKHGQFISNDAQMTIPATIKVLDLDKTAPLPQLPKKLTAIMGKVNSLSRHGVIQYCNTIKDVDISFVSSILYILMDRYKSLTPVEAMEFIELFIRKIQRDAKKKYIEFNYKQLNWKTREFALNVQNFIHGKDLLRYIADYLYVNIFIIDIKTDSIVYIGEELCIKYKKNILLIGHDTSQYEPVTCNDELWFPHDSSIIRKFTNSRFLVERMDCNFTNVESDTEFIVGDEDLTKFMPKYNCTDSIKQQNKVELKEMIKDNESDDLNGFGEKRSDIDITTNMIDNKDDDDDNDDIDTVYQHIINDTTKITKSSNMSGKTASSSDDIELSNNYYDLKDIDKSDETGDEIDMPLSKELINNKNIYKDVTKKIDNSDSDRHKKSGIFTYTTPETIIQDNPKSVKKIVVSHTTTKVNKYDKTELQKMRLATLKDLAKENNINTVSIKNNKKRAYTRAEYIEDLSNVLF